MDVLNYIMKEHDNIKEMIAGIEAAVGERKKEIFRELYAEMHGHHEAEEEVVFPMLKEKKDEGARKVVLEMIEEHNLESYQLNILEKTPVGNATWDAKFSVLKELLEHHMEEEEEEFMTLAKKMIPKEKLVDIRYEFETVLEEKRSKRKRILVPMGDYPLFRVNSRSV